MPDREFRDNALISVSASLAGVQQSAQNQYTPGTILLPVDEVASRAACIVMSLIEQRKTMEAKK